MILKTRKLLNITERERERQGERERERDSGVKSGVSHKLGKKQHTIEIYLSHFACFENLHQHN